MQLTQIANADLVTRMAEDAEQIAHRDFGQDGHISTLALEDGRVIVAVYGHDGVGCPGENWHGHERQAYDPPTFFRAPTPDAVPEALQEAHQAADAALKREASAVQAAKSTRADLP